jgi:hypothetical protein
MPSLSDAVFQNKYKRGCFDLYDNWASQIPAERERKLKFLINEIFRSCRIPELSFYFKTMPHGEYGSFFFTEWRMDIRRELTQAQNISEDDFTEMCVTLYHEARHSEQWFSVAHALARGDVGGAGRQTAQAISATMFIPRTIGLRAEMLKLTSLYNPLFTVTQWYNSVYGAGAAQRNNILNHGTFRAYRNLAEEQDAHAIEQSIRRIFKGSFGYRARDEAIPHIRNLFK